MAFENQLYSTAEVPTESAYSQMPQCVHIPLGNNTGCGKVRIGNDGFFGHFGEGGERCDHRLPHTVLGWVEHGARVLSVCCQGGKRKREREKKERIVAYFQMI